MKVRVIPDKSKTQELKEFLHQSSDLLREFRKFLALLKAATLEFFIYLFLLTSAALILAEKLGWF